VIGLCRAAGRQGRGVWRMAKAAKLRRKRALRAKRGRPRDEGVPRTASGRKSRARQPREDPRMVVIAARQRVLGLSKEHAANEKAETALGRLWLAGSISEPMRQAGERYVEIYLNAMRALKAPMGLAVSDSGSGGGDEVTEDYVVWATKAVARYRALKVVLEDLDNEASTARIVNAVTLQNTPPPDTWLPALRKGLSLLVVKLGVGGEE
jgi:hypothetical protein